MNGTGDDKTKVWKVKPEWPFLMFLLLVLSAYVGLLLLLVGANVLVISWSEITGTLAVPEIQESIKLTFVTCTATAILSVLVAVPVAYMLSRYQFRGKALVDTLLDIPILLPPLIVGLSLLILFNRISATEACGILAAGFLVSGLWALIREGRGLVSGVLGGLGLVFVIAAVSLHGDAASPEDLVSAAGFPITFHPLGVVLAQFPVAAAFAIRMMRTTFDQINPRYEEVAMSLGCNRGQAFSKVALPLAGKGMIAAGTMAWARALGEFGPILVFAGATRGRTEVLSTSVFLEIETGNLAGAAALSLLMILIAVGTLLLVRFSFAKGGGQ